MKLNASEVLRIFPMPQTSRFYLIFPFTLSFLGILAPTFRPNSSSSSTQLCHVEFRKPRFSLPTMSTMKNRLGRSLFTLLAQSSNHMLMKSRKNSRLSRWAAIFEFSSSTWKAQFSRILLFFLYVWENIKESTRLTSERDRIERVLCDGKWAIKNVERREGGWGGGRGR